MFYTYILRSLSHPQALYTGSTSNLRTRLQDHNSGKSPHTSQFTPWTVVFYPAFPNKSLSHQFEKYLKSGSGRAFTSKHLLPAKPLSKLPAHPANPLPIPT